MRFDWQLRTQQRFDKQQLTLCRDNNANTFADVLLQPGSSVHLHDVHWRELVPPTGFRRVDLRPLDVDSVHLDVDAKCKLRGADEDSQTSVGVEVFHQT